MAPEGIRRKRVAHVKTRHRKDTINQDKLCKPARRVAQDGALEIWARTLADSGTAVGLFNRGEAPATVTVRWSDLGLKGPLKVRDLWSHADLGNFSEEYAADVPAHGVVLLKLAR